MPQLRRPSQRQIDARLADSDQPFTYPETGATSEIGDAAPASLARIYDVDRYAFPMGTGRDTFERARDAMLAWRHFEIPWVALHGGHAPAAAGQVVATLVRVAGLWFLSPCRVVYTSTPDARSNTAAFAYGTLPGHPEQGEERFRVSIDPASEAVTFDVVAFSRPATALAKLGYPFARRLQRRFVSAAAQALERASADRGGGSSGAGTP